MKSKLIGTLFVCFLISAIFVRGGDLLSGMKAQVSLPPNVVTFITAKEQQSYEIVAKSDFTLPLELAYYFAAAKAGRAQEAKQIYSGLLSDTNAPAYKTPLKQVALDAELVLEAYAAGDSNLVTGLANDLMNSLPAGCIYFGGTDPGRGLPALLCKAPGDPVFVLSQNAFLDGRYLAYIREMYGARIQLPAPNEVKEIIDVAYAGRSKTGFNSPNAWTTASGQILKSIIAENTGCEFYYEESFPLENLYSNLSPHGLVMKINHQPLARISDDDIKTSTDFWSAKIAQFTNNPTFAVDNYAWKSYAHCRSAIAGLYAWRTQTAKDAGERERMFEAATNAFGQSLMMDAAMPETVFREVNLFLAVGKLDEAIAVAKNASLVAPSNVQFKTLVAQLQNMKTKVAGASEQTQAKPSVADRLKQLESLYQQGLINKEDYERKKKEILDSI